MLFWWSAQTSMVAAGLAGLAALACRSRRLGPEARHALWLVVLVKFAIPPALAWPWPIPAAWPSPAGPAPALEVPARGIRPDPTPGPVVERADPVDPPPAPEVAAVRPVEARAVPIPGVPEPVPALPARRPSVGPTLLAVWLAGSAAVAGRRGRAVVRFRRSLRGSTPAPGWLVEEARSVGDRLGVRVPPIRVVEGSGTPLLWCLGRPVLVVPSRLVDRLGPDRWAGILAHELAHLARGDHWVARAELVLGAAWWWHPVYRLARRRLIEEAERAADARVIRELPGRRLAYAEALVEVCAQMARPSPPPPSLGVAGAGAARTLERRLTMILRDPIPRSPGRRWALAVGLLATLSAPSWGLGQTPEPPRAADTPAEPPKPAPAPSREYAIAEVRAGVGKRLLGRPEALGFRHAVATRRHPAHPMNPGEMVLIQAADVVLGRGPGLRLDVLVAPPSGQPRPDAPTDPYRRFVARDGSSAITFGGPISETGPVPFRWMASGDPAGRGDDLARELAGEVLMLNQRNDPTDPLEPRPANLLDLAGAAELVFDEEMGIQAEVAGHDVVDGREVVRVAWVSQRGLRGLSWVAPSLGFATIRSEATQDPGQPGAMTPSVRRTWRKSAADFVEVGPLWLPRRVEDRLTEVDSQGRTTASREVVARFEGFRADPPLAADAFRPKFAIEALDEKTGSFTTRPPAPAPELVARLARAVAESPFGPPGLREPAPAPAAVVGPARAEPATPAVDDPARARREARAADLAKAEARRTLAAAVVARNNAHTRRSPNLVSREEIARGEADLQVAETEVAARRAEMTRDESPRRSPDRRPEAGEPGPVASPSTLADFRDAVELLEVQLPARQAELRAAEARLEPARNLVAIRKRLAEQGAVAQDARVEAEAGLQAVEAEVGRRKAEVQEAEVRLRQARRRAEAEEARLRREVARARAELDRTEEMMKNKIIGMSALEAARGRFDDLMFQLDPKYVPSHPAPPTPTPAARR